MTLTSVKDVLKHGSFRPVCSLGVYNCMLVHLPVVEMI